MSDVSDEDDDDILHESPIDDEDVFLAELRSKPANDDVSVAASGILPTNDISPTNNVFTDSVDPQPVEDSPSLFSVDATNNGTVHLHSTTTRSSGRKPAKILEVSIPLRTPTHPSLVTGKIAEKRDNTEISGQSDPETSPKKNKSGSRRKKRNRLLVNNFVHRIPLIDCYVLSVSVRMLVNQFQSIYYPPDDANFFYLVATYARNYFHVLVKLLHCY